MRWYDDRPTPGSGSAPAYCTSLPTSTRPCDRRPAPVLRRLADAAGATAHFTIADGGEALALVVVEPTWTDFHVGYRVGSRHPLERGAAGRAILAGRRGGAAVVTTRGELQQGATGLAAPVLGTPALEASVGVVTVRSLDEPRVAVLVAQAARDVADALRLSAG